MITKAPRGVEDWYGDRIILRNILERRLRALAHSFNMKEIITPIFEHTVLFQRGVGETTDIVQKEMYTFSDKSGRSLTLKPEGTAGCMRAFLENGLKELPSPLKLYYITPAFRYEKPQSGRLRQHHQFGVEVIGSDKAIVELEVIKFVNTFFEELGLTGYKLHINSIGHKESRIIYNKKLLNFLHEHENGLCPLCKERMKKNPLRVLDCKETSCKRIVENAPKTIDNLTEDDVNAFERLKQLLDIEGIDYVVDDKVVRGLDYYTGLVFEFITRDGLTVCGGGRYDDLINEIDEKTNLPSVGFGMGIERLIDVINKGNITLFKDDGVDYYIGFLGANEYILASKIINFLRTKGFNVETDCMGRSLRAQMKYANKIKAKRVIIIGENEVATNTVVVKDMIGSDNKEINLDNMEDLVNE